jgi:predicted regulator of Ras-like GTPase activity (Roadblock/LC7/MglB family)
MAQDRASLAARNDRDGRWLAPRSWRGILADVADDVSRAPEIATADAPAERALAFLNEMSPDMRGAAILAADGAVLAADGDANRWREDAAALFAAADRADEEPAEQIHIGTEQGEVFALRHAGLAAVAVTERFALASLLLFDMRALLRELANGNGNGNA